MGDGERTGSGDGRQADAGPGIETGGGGSGTDFREGALGEDTGDAALAYQPSEGQRAQERHVDKPREVLT